MICNCETTELRWRTRRNKVRVIVEQCLACGRELRAVSKNSPEVQSTSALLDFDEELMAVGEVAQRKAYWAAHQSEIEQRQEANRQKQEDYRQDMIRQQVERREAWFQRYNVYLESPKWKSKRRRVLERDQHLCKACGFQKATQVHHLTYAHVFNEPLFDLVSVCEQCHKKLHQKPDQEKD